MSTATLVDVIFINILKLSLHQSLSLVFCYVLSPSSPNLPYRIASTTRQRRRRLPSIWTADVVVGGDAFGAMIGSDDSCVPPHC